MCMTTADSITQTSCMVHTPEACSSDISTSSSGDSGGASVTPVDCFLNSSRVQTIATSFGITIFALVYAASPFSGKSDAGHCQRMCSPDRGLQTFN